MNGIDLYVLHALYAARDDSTVQMFVWITELGSTLMIGGITLALALKFLVRSYLSLLAGLCVSVGGSAAMVFALKEIIARARPEALYQAYQETGFSFPSGHAALSLALYGFLVFLAWRRFPSHIARIVSTGTAILLVTAIGFSRLYLGLHYLSDVVAGYLLGATFLGLGIYVSEKLSRSSQGGHSIWS